MRKMVLFLIVIIGLVLTTNAYAEVFAFEKTEYTVFVDDFISVKPVLQGIEKKLNYTWETSDENIARVKNGKVVGVSEGTAVIKCVAESKEKETYEASYQLHVLIPVKKIKVEEKDMNVFKGVFYEIEAVVEPENASNKEIEWESSDEEIIFAFENGRILALGNGKATITAKAKDGSGAKAKINVSVPPIAVTETKVVVSEKEGKLFGYQTNTSGIIGINYSDKLFEMERTEIEEQKDRSHSEVNWGIIRPKKAGTGYISFNVNGRTTKIKVIVEHSAVFDQVSYPEKTIKNIIEQFDEIKEKQISVEGEIEKIENKGNTKALVKQKDSYFIFETDDIKLIEGQKVRVYGTCDKVEEYISETGLRYDCAIIKAEKVEEIK